jgi:hypothetical protein
LTSAAPSVRLGRRFGIERVVSFEQWEFKLFFRACHRHFQILQGNRRAVAVCKNPQQQQDIPRVMKMAEKFGLEFLPPPGV